MTSNHRKVLIVLPILFLTFGLLSKNVFGSVVNTQNIIRQTPPTPPAPPTKPEPPNPPTPPPHCDDPGCFTPTPTPTPRPSESPAPTSTPTQPPAGGESGGTGGAPFQLGGPPPPPPVSGQVLGASVLGATGSFEENLFYLVFISGAVLTSLGIMKYAPARIKK